MISLHYAAQFMEGYFANNMLHSHRT